MNEISEKELLDDSGVAGGGGNFIPVISIDNGSDLVGADATGHFIIKEFDKERGLVDKKKAFDKTGFNAVIIKSRAIVSDKGKNKSWISGEFNPIKKNEPFPVFQLGVDGKIMKDQQGTPKLNWGTYDQLKARQSSTKPNGEIQRYYEFSYVLYLLVKDEEGEKNIIKLKFKGTGRGHFIDYTKKISGKNLQLPYIYTSISSKADPEANNKYSVYFKETLDEQGQNVKADYDSVMEALRFLHNKEQTKLSALPKSDTYMLEGETTPPPINFNPALAPEVPIGQTQVTSQVKDTISIDDLPFN